MRFKLDNIRDMERLARIVKALQDEGVEFYLDRKMNPAGELADYAVLVFGKE